MDYHARQLAVTSIAHNSKAEIPSRDSPDTIAESVGAAIPISRAMRL